MRRWKQILAGGLAACLLAIGVVPAAGAEESSFDPAHFLGLTQAQRLEDYDYLVKTLGNSYLCMGVRDREKPDDPSEEIFKDYREMVAESDSDEDFYKAVYSTLYRLGPYGHMWMIEPENYQRMLDWCKNQDTVGREHWRDILEDPVTQKGYERLAELMEFYGEDESGSWSEGEAGENVRTLLLEESGVAYVKIDSFPAEFEEAYAEDQKTLTAFFNAAGKCKDLIIDITDNSGGNEGYWQNLIVAPLIDQPLSCTNYALLANSGNNRPYIENVFSPEDLHPISELPKLPKLNRDGIEAATHFVESTLAVKPAAKGAAFRGNVWVLVGPYVYSASESFSVFCQQTGFATLVGEKTGGDGIGALDPIFLRLPNSGLLVQFTMMYGLNADGSSSEEAGTTPDVCSPAGEPPLITALRAALAERKS